MTPWDTWASTPDIIDHPAVTRAHQSQDEAEIDRAYARYYKTLKGRIAWLEEHLPHLDRGELPRAHLTLAVLHDNDDMKTAASVYKRMVRYHAAKALRLGHVNARAYALLGTAYDWIATLSCMRGKVPEIQVAGPFETREEADRHVWASVDNTGVEFMSGATRVRFARRAVRMLRKAVELAPGDADYARWLENAETLMERVLRESSDRE